MGLVKKTLIKIKKMIHKCDQCGESFTENRNLTRHIQSKHADVKYSCDKCNFQAIRKDTLNRHIKSKHAKSSEKFIEQNNDDPIADAASEFWQPWKNKPEKRKNSKGREISLPCENRGSFLEQKFWLSRL